MTKVFLTAACVAVFGTSALAQGIEPVSVVPQTDVTVGTLAVDSTVLIAVVVGAIVVAGAVAASDGS